MPRYCPTCNKSSAEVSFYGDFCVDCASKKLASVLGNGAVEIVKCKRCGRLKLKGQFMNLDERALEEVIANRFNGYTVHLLGSTDHSAAVEIAEVSDKGTLAVVKELEIDYKKVLCGRCFKKAANYHEAVVQLRGEHDKLERMARRIEIYFARNGEFVSKIEESDDGIDMYLSSKRLANEFMSEARLHPIVSFTLAGLKGGRRVYKNTYALHFDDPHKV